MIQPRLFFLVLAGILLVACSGPAATAETGAGYPAPPAVSSPGGQGESPPYPAGSGSQAPGGATSSPDKPVESPAYPAPGVISRPTPLPAAGDENMIRGNVFIEGHEILVLESFPPQFMLNLTGSLPTPCHQFRADVSKPDAQNRINVEVYSLADPDQICIQVLEPFEESVPLGSFTSGKFTVLVNGKEIGEISP